MGTRAKQARKERRRPDGKTWSQADVAREAKVSQNTVWAIENDETFDSRMLLKVAKALDVNPYWLKDGTLPKSYAAWRRTLEELPPHVRKQVEDFADFAAKRSDS